MAYGRRRRARFATLASGCIIIVFGLVVLLATPTVGAATTATLNPDHVGTVGTTATQNCGQGPGWIFVLPDSQGDAFVSLSATFQTAGTVPGTVLANNKFASVNVPLTDKLLGATAQIIGGDEDSTFNLTHVCEEGQGSSSTTTTTTVPETTTTAAETTTTAPETTTSTTEPETTTTAAETTTTEVTTTTESTTTTPTSTSTSTTTAPQTTTSTSFAVEGTTIVSSSTTTLATVLTAGSTLPSASSTAGGTVTGAATGTALPRTGNTQGVPVLGLVALALGACLVLGSHRRFWRS
jgi:hypothetical protein